MDTSEFLRRLESTSVYVMREANAIFKKPVLMFAGGKDSTLMLYLAKEAFLDHIPFPIYFVDTGYQFKETYEYLDHVEDIWGVKIHRFHNDHPLDDLVPGGVKVDPYNYPKSFCCAALKTDALRKIILKNKFDCVFVGVRWTEQEHRAKEYFFSPRKRPIPHTRVHPLLEWPEYMIWQATLEWNLPVNPLYKRVKDGKRIFSIGCEPCTDPVPTIFPDGEISVEDMIKETRNRPSYSEREGRCQDKENIMDTLRGEWATWEERYKNRYWRPGLR